LIQFSSLSIHSIGLIIKFNMPSRQQ